MDTMVDIFNSRAFETTTMTAAINKVPYVPQVLGQMGLFEEEGVATTSVFVERKGSAIALVPTSPRGAPGTPVQGDKRDAIPFKIPRLAATSQVMADEVQNVRAFGSVDQVTTLEQVRDAKLTKMSLGLDLTLEYHRIGAVQGVVYDSDGTTVLYDLPTLFGITQRSEVDFNLDATYDPNDPAKSGSIRKAIAGIRRDMNTDLEMGVDAVNQIAALCSDTYFDAITAAPEVRQTYLNQQAANDLRDEKNPLDMVSYGGCLFMNYRGSGSVKIPDDKAQFFPLNIPGLFITRFGPADYMEAVNTIGLPKYTKAALDPTGFNRYIALEAQSNPLNLCTRPKLLRKGKIT